MFALVDVVAHCRYMEGTSHIQLAVPLCKFVLNIVTGNCGIEGQATKHRRQYCRQLDEHECWSRSLNIESDETNIGMFQSQCSGKTRPQTRFCIVYGFMTSETDKKNHLGIENPIPEHLPSLGGNAMADLPCHLRQNDHDIVPW